jgi:hypothetical protein
MLMIKNKIMNGVRIEYYRFLKEDNFISQVTLNLTQLIKLKVLTLLFLSLKD